MIDLFRLLQIQDQLKRQKQREESLDTLRRLREESLSKDLKIDLRRKQNDRFDQRSRDQDKLRNHDLD